MEFKQIVRRTLSVAVGMSAGVVASASSAQTSFDGLWSVEIVAKATACSLAYAVPIQVANGNITYAGLFDAVADGTVGDDGEVRVQLARSGDVVQATGALGERSGFGQWSSATLECQGTWSARKG
jgi:hypothetical protein